MADQADVAVECIAEEARPPPKFTWFLGEDQLNVRIANENYFALSCSFNIYITIHLSEKHI